VNSPVPLKEQKGRVRQSRNRRRLAGFALAAVIVLAGGCGSHPGGDPGNRRLKELSHDAVFAVFPPSATNVHVTRTPAKYVSTPFQGSGWNGPSVEVTFKSSAPVAEVYRFYAEKAAAVGWRATKRNVQGFVFQWDKTYSDRAQA